MPNLEMSSSSIIGPRSSLVPGKLKEMGGIIQKIHRRLHAKSFKVTPAFLKLNEKVFLFYSKNIFISESVHKEELLVQMK